MGDCEKHHERDNNMMNFLGFVVVFVMTLKWVWQTDDSVRNRNHSTMLTLWLLLWLHRMSSFIHLVCFCCLFQGCTYLPFSVFLNMCTVCIRQEALHCSYATPVCLFSVFYKGLTLILVTWNSWNTAYVCVPDLKAIVMSSCEEGVDFCQNRSLIIVMCCFVLLWQSRKCFWINFQMWMDILTFALEHFLLLEH